MSASRLDREEVLARLGLVAAAAFLFTTGFRIYPAAPSSGLALFAMLLLYVGGFALLLFAVGLRSAAHRRVLWLIGGCSAVALICSVSYGILFEIPSYGTDVMALAHAGGEVLLDGLNPYSATQEDVEWILRGLDLRDDLMTETLSGQPIPGVTYYPGVHVLIFTGGLAVGLSDLRWVTLVFELAALTALWLTVSERVRFLLPAVLLLEPYMMIYFTAGGVTDWLWVLPLTFGAISLHRSNYTAAGIWIGLACAVKQQPWFAVPFVLVWVYKTSKGSAHDKKLAVKHTVTFLTMVVLGFALPNFPFILWSIEDWATAILGPALLDLVPAGQGIVVLASEGYLGLSRAGFGVLVALVTGVLGVIYFIRFERLKNVLWVLPALVLFFSYRSLHNYFVFWLPLVVLWLDLRILSPEAPELASSSMPRSPAPPESAESHPI